MYFLLWKFIFQGNKQKKHQEVDTKLHYVWGKTGQQQNWITANWNDPNRGTTAIAVTKILSIGSANTQKCPHENVKWKEQKQMINTELQYICNVCRDLNSDHKTVLNSTNRL